MTLIRSSVTCFLAFLVVCACSSTSTTNRQQYQGGELARPGRILVYDFTANASGVPSESSFATSHAVSQTALTPQELELTTELGAEIAKQVTEQLRDAGLPAVLAAGQPVPQVNDVLIRGYFVSVDTGGGVRRVLIGFGSGSAELTTAVEGFQMTPLGPHLLGSGTVDSVGGKAPGVILPLAVMAASGTPVGLIVGGTLKLAGEVTGATTIEGAARRTADEISEQLIDAAERRGWL
jgi:hypothetical protein